MNNKKPPQLEVVRSDKSAAKAVMMKDPAHVKQLEAQARKEFKDWKDTLKRIIDKEARCVFSRERGAWHFELPPTLLQLVTESLIRARVDLERHPNKREAIGKALEQLRGELSVAADAVISRELGAKADSGDAEEEEAKKVLEQMRAEFVRNKQEEQEDGSED